MGFALTHPEEVALIRRAQGGDPDAYAALIECYRKPIHRLLQALTNSAHATEDLAQDVFLKAWVKLKSFDCETCFLAWLACIAKNAFLNSRRRRSPSSGRDACINAKPTVAPDPVAALMAREIQAIVDDAVASLPATNRAAFCLRIHQGLSYGEIGEALSLTPGAARWHVCRARRLLRERLRSLLSYDL